MSAIKSLPARYRSVPSLSSMASSLDQARGRARQAESKSKSPAALIEMSVATQIGAALSGAAHGRGWTPGTIGIGAGALAVAGFVMRQSVLVYAANGALAPLVFLQASAAAQARPVPSAA